MKGKTPKERTDYSKPAISKYLTWILRHGATEENISIRPDGFVKLSDITTKKRAKDLKMKLDIIQEVVNTNEKKRYTLKQEGDEWWIKANQGHSIQVYSLLRALTDLTWLDFGR